MMKEFIFQVLVTSIIVVVVILVKEPLLLWGKRKLVRQSRKVKIRLLWGLADLAWALLEIVIGTIELVFRIAEWIFSGFQPTTTDAKIKKGAKSS